MAIVFCMGALPVLVHISHLKAGGPRLMVMAFVVCSCRVQLKSAGVKDLSMRSKHSSIRKLLIAMRHCIGMATLSKPEKKVRVDVKANRRPTSSTANTALQSKHEHKEQHLACLCMCMTSKCQAIAHEAGHAWSFIG